MTTFLFVWTRNQVSLKKTKKVWAYVQTVDKQGSFQPYFSPKKVWTKTFELAKSDIDVQKEW